MTKTKKKKAAAPKSLPPRDRLILQIAGHTLAEVVRPILTRLNRLDAIVFSTGVSDLMQGEPLSAALDKQEGTIIYAPDFETEMDRVGESTWLDRHIKELEHADARISRAINTLRGLADRLTGPQPEQGSSESGKTNRAIGQNLSSQAADAVENLHGGITELDKQLNRLAKFI